jgi:hypothetical protein
VNEEELVKLTKDMILEVLRPTWVKEARSYLRAAQAAVDEAQRHLNRVGALIENADPS